MTTQPEPECCPRFDPSLWDDKSFKWENKLFIKDKVFSFFYIPLNFGSVITRLTKKTEQSEAKFLDAMCLSDHSSMWNMNIYVAVDKKVENTEDVTISGSFVSKVYEGEFKDTGKWCKDFEQYVADKKMSVKKMYMWYTTCPKCAKKYGKNYVVIVGQV